VLLVAQRVRSRDGKQGINAFCYQHPHPRIWLGAVPREVLEGPRTLVNSRIEVSPPGNNAVRSFLDIWFPEIVSDHRITDRILRAADLLADTTQTLPWSLETGDVTFMFNADHALALGWREELSILLAHALSVRVP
jgi:hypothetical protein